MGFRRKGREYALQSLFQIDVSHEAVENVFPLFWEGREEPQELRDFTERLVKGVGQNITRLDSIIAEHAEHWRLNRMAIVDRNILRIAIYEFLYEVDTPLIVVIDEAIEIAKKFGSDESGAFINGVLDAVKKKVEDGRLQSLRCAVQ